MADKWKGQVPTTKPSTKAVSGFFMGTAIPPQMGRTTGKSQDKRDGQVRKVSKVRFA
jgi:hypothetical protein